MKLIKRVTVSGAWFALALMTMANQECQDPKAGEARKLKKSVGFYGVTGRDFILPGRTEFNPGPFATLKLRELIDKHPDFYARARLPVGTTQIQAETPSCLLDPPLLLLGGSIPTFEMVSTVEGSFGYNKEGAFGKVSANATVKIERAQLDVHLESYEPLTRELQAIGAADATQTRTEIKADVNFNDIPASFKAFFDSKVGKTVEKALNKAIDAFAEAVKYKEIEWQAQVIDDQDRFITINAGRFAGLRPGDVFTVHNQNYYWHSGGRPCEVPLRSQGNATTEPTAIIVIKSVSDHTAISELDPVRPGGLAAQPGAVVRLKEFAKPPANQSGTVVP